MLPDNDVFEATRPAAGVQNWAVEKEYDTSMRLRNTETGEHVQLLLDEEQEEIRLVPMVSSGAGYSSVQSEGETYDAADEESIAEAAWALARRIRNGDIGRDDADMPV